MKYNSAKDSSSSVDSCHPLEIIRAQVDAIHGEFVQIADAAKLSESKPLPKIPEVVFVCTKGEEREEFESRHDLFQWVLDCFDKEVADVYWWVVRDGQTGCDGYQDWWMSYGEMEDVESILDAKDWTLERRAL